MNRIKNRTLIIAYGNVLTTVALLFIWIYWLVWGINFRHWPCVASSALLVVLYLRDAVRCVRKAVAETDKSRKASISQTMT